MNTTEHKVLALIGEDPDDPDVFTDDSEGMEQIRDSINDGTEEITALTGIYKRTIQIPLKADKNVYQIETTQDQFAWVTNVWLFGRRSGLEQVGFFNLIKFNPRWLYNSGSPERYALIGYDKICVHPAPSSSSDILDITCAMIPIRYTLGTDKILLRDTYEWGVVHYAVGEYYASRGDAATAVWHHAKYMQAAKLMRLKPELPDRNRYYQTDKH